MSSIENSENCPYGEFSFPTDEEVAEAKEFMRSWSPAAARLVDQLDNPSKPPIPEYTRKEIIIDGLVVVVPRVVLGVAGTALAALLLWGSSPQETTTLPSHTNTPKITHPK